MNKKVCKVLFVIIGTLIGAGFASGQEINIFFYQYGSKGLLGILISSILIGLVIRKTIMLSQKYKIETYKQFLEIFIRNKIGAEIFNIIINIFILITFYIMVAGFGAYVEQQAKIHSIIGSTLLALICFIIFSKNVSGLVKVNEIIVPILVFCIVAICTKIINAQDWISIISLETVTLKNKWILDSMLYGSYNTILLIPVLITIKNLLNSKKEVTIVAILTTSIFAILAIIIFAILSKIDINILEVEMPAVYVVSQISNFFRYIYGFIILSSILTTSASLGTSLLKNIAKNKKQNLIYAILICVTAVIVSRIGFSKLVKLLYPIFGYMGIIQLIAFLIF